MSNLGWDEQVILRKRPEQVKVTKSQTAINAARRAGAHIETEKKSMSNSSHANTDHQRIAKLDRTDEIVAVPKISMDVGKAMQRARQEKKMTQKEVGEKINEKANVINDYEAGRAIPNQQILGKLERALGVKLRGKDIGSPLDPRGAKNKK